MTFSSVSNLCSYIVCCNTTCIFTNYAQFVNNNNCMMGQYRNVNVNHRLQIHGSVSSTHNSHTLFSHHTSAPYKLKLSDCKQNQIHKASHCKRNSGIIYFKFYRFGWNASRISNRDKNGMYYSTFVECKDGN